jgi:hypothetical protein
MPKLDLDRLSRSIEVAEQQLQTSRAFREVLRELEAKLNSTNLALPVQFATILSAAEDERVRNAMELSAESPRELRRLQLLREWSYEQDKQVFT